MGKAPAVVGGGKRNAKDEELVSRLWCDFVEMFRSVDRPWSFVDYQ